MLTQVPVHFWCSSVTQFVTAHDPFTGVTAMTNVDHQSSLLKLNAFGKDFHLPSSHSLVETRSKQDRTLQRNRPVQITCNVCGKCFRFPCDFKRHSVMHTGERVFKCDECQKSFKLLSHLKMHIYRFHAGERHYPCDTCGKKYASVTDLKCHLVVHSSERLHACSICSKGFFSAKELRTHMQTHTGEKQFECDMCKRKFLRRAHLEKHIVFVHIHKRQRNTHTGNRKFKVLDQQAKKKWF